MTQDTELPALPEPELTSWYGPSSEFYQEAMFSDDQMRAYAREAFEAGRKAAAQECVSICMDERARAERDLGADDYSRGLTQAEQLIRIAFGKAKP